MKKQKNDALKNMRLDNGKSMFQMSKANFKKMMDQLIKQFQLEKKNSQENSESPKTPLTPQY